MYVNAVDLAFWDSKAAIGNWEGDVPRRDDPLHHNIVAAGVNYEDAMRILISNFRGLGLDMPGSMLANLMREAEAHDKDDKSGQDQVYVGLVMGTMH